MQISKQIRAGSKTVVSSNPKPLSSSERPNVSNKTVCFIMTIQIGRYCTAVAVLLLIIWAQQLIMITAINCDTMRLAGDVKSPVSWLYLPIKFIRSFIVWILSCSSDVLVRKHNVCIWFMFVKICQSVRGYIYFTSNVFFWEKSETLEESILNFEEFLNHVIITTVAEF